MFACCLGEFWSFGAGLGNVLHGGRERPQIIFLEGARAASKDWQTARGVMPTRLANYSHWREGIAANDH